MSPYSFGWGGWIRTSAWRHQKPLPYRLATPQHSKRVFYSIICIKGERSKLFTKMQSGNFLLAASACFRSLKETNIADPVPDN